MSTNEYSARFYAMEARRCEDQAAALREKAADFDKRAQAAWARNRLANDLARAEPKEPITLPRISLAEVGQ